MQSAVPGRKRVPTSALLGLPLLIVASSAAAESAPPCYGRLNVTYRFEEACFTLLRNGTGGFSLREYAADAAGGGVNLVAYDVPSSVTVYQEAIEMSAFYVIEYFNATGNAAGKKIESSRTVPLLFRPPTKAFDTWRGSMALAPSVWPAGKAPPAPKYGAELVPLGMGAAPGPLLVAVQSLSSDQSPQPSDFDALCAKLKASVAKQAPGYAVDESSAYTYTHARYFGYEFYSGPFEIECWAGVVKK
jgi:hypothetical protein